MHHDPAFEWKTPLGYATKIRRDNFWPKYNSRTQCAKFNTTPPVKRCKKNLYEYRENFYLKCCDLGLDVGPYMIEEKTFCHHEVYIQVP